LHDNAPLWELCFLLRSVSFLIFVCGNMTAVVFVDLGDLGAR
jgi:hypothetical protein